MRCKIIVLLLLTLNPYILYSQQREKIKITLQGIVQDSQTQEVLSFATVQLMAENQHLYGIITDSKGHFRIPSLPTGTYQLTVSYIGYNTYNQAVTLSQKDVFLTVNLTSAPTLLNEVIVTATESKGLTTASTINRAAMEHLQPSSFTDLLELLPGGKFQEPDMGKANLIRIREAGSTNEPMASLGISFMIDGSPVNTGGNLLYVPGQNQQELNSKESVSRGVDMRSISTGNIESVEVIRGIPSVEYGQLTSGLVNIRLKSTESPFIARFKADAKSKLFEAGKGVKLNRKDNILNVDLSYLDSKVDPRDPLENYKRYTFSSRWNLSRETSSGHLLKWNANAAYTGTLDAKKKDTEMILNEENYKSSFNKIKAGAGLRVHFPENYFIKTLGFIADLSQSFNKIDQTRRVALDRPTAIPKSTETGVNDGEYLPTQYIASAIIEDRPLDLNLKLPGEFVLQTGNMDHEIKAGLQWNYTKNIGDGFVYDPNRPLAFAFHYRPRPYKDIPSRQQLSIYAEEKLKIPAGRHLFTFVAGLRGESLLNVSKEFKMSGKIYVDPRFNLQWKLPVINGWYFDVSAGIGRHSLLPGISHLYPDPYYIDIEQLNYYHENPQYSRINLMTHKLDLTNYNLQPARNLKWEIRLGASYKGNNFSITYFREQMNNGLRRITDYYILPYKRYDASGLDHSNITGPPVLEELPYENDVLLTARSNIWGNDARIHKQGIEFQFASQRIKAIRTKVTVDGAWFRTTTSNDAPFYDESSIVLGGKELKYIGLYEWEDGDVKERFETKVKLDTQIKELGLRFSTDLQCTWFTSTKNLWNSGTPVSYIDKQGTIHPFKEEDKEDMQLRHLVHNYGPDYFTAVRVPFAMDIHLKATKEIGRYVELALYVNRIITIYPDYYSYGVLTRRQTSPYFGMEMNLKF